MKMEVVVFCILTPCSEYGANKVLRNVGTLSHTARYQTQSAMNFSNTLLNIKKETKIM